jgi:hypothetical protein
MREPPLRVRVLGHPVVMIPVMGMGAFILYQWTQHPEIALLGFAAIAAMALVAKASERRMEFVRWRRAWGSMADGKPASQGPMLAKLAIGVIVPTGFIAHASGALDGLTGPATTLAILAVVLAAGTMLVRRWHFASRRARPASRSDVVSVCAHSVIAVPSMTDAYSALPAHCWHVLNSGTN